jgi:predicted AlkP superfamily phosphohydrolase/phosphomutase
VFDWGTWAWYGTPASQPAGLLLDLKKKFGPYPLGMEAKKLGLRIPEAEDLERRLIQSIGYKFQTLNWLLAQGSWDLAAVGFGEPHPAGHYLWPADTSSITDSNESKFEPLYRVYQALDQNLGTLVNGLEGETLVLVVSGDGVRANRVACHLLGPALEKLGYTVGFGGQGEQAKSTRPKSLLGRARSMMPSGTRRWVADHLPWWLRDRLGSQAAAAEIDWSKTKAFTLPTDLEGCIRINLRGREPQGMVQPGAEYDNVCKSIAADLGSLRNPTTGKRAVREVWIRNQVFPGRRQEFLPDLVVSWEDEAPFDALGSRAGEVTGSNPDRRTGTHSPEAFLLAAGPGVTPGLQLSARLVDIAPTVLALLGLQPGKEMEGRSIDFEKIPADLAAKTV